MHQDIKKEWAENATLRSTKLKLLNCTARTLEQNTGGSVTQVLPHPPQEVARNSEVHKLVENDTPVGDIEGTLQVYKGDDTSWGEASVQLHEAMMGTTLGKEAVESRG